VKNFELARLFYEIASLLEVRDESRFRIRAWQRAAQTLETLTEDVTAVAAIRQGFPVYIFSGTADPIHANLAWLDKLVARYTEVGLDVTTRYHAEGRHEMLNETNRDDVVADLVAWLERVVPNKSPGPK